MQKNQLNPIDAFKLCSVGEEMYNKVDFLQQILNDEDDEGSSDLQGHQINKLLTEQEDLESDYLQLIEKRKKLKGFSNKDRLAETQNEIKDRAKKIKESTKKICRLFSDNQNASGDKEKIKKDMGFVKDLFQILRNDLDENNSFKQFNDAVFNELKGQDALRGQQDREKELTKKIRELKAKYNQMIQDFQQDDDEGQKTIEKFKKDKIKALQVKDMTKNYADKESQGSNQTEDRLNKQKLDEKQSEINEIQRKKKTEELVFERMKNFLEKKANEKQQEKQKWAAKKTEALEELEAQIKTLTAKKEKYGIQLQEMREKQIENEMETHAQEEAEEQAELTKEFQRIENRRLDKMIKLIQDEWVKAGTKTKKKGKKKKKKKKK